MAHWLCSRRERQAEGVVSRFDSRFWTVNFPRPMMAAATNPAPDALRVDAVFYRRDDLAGLIWEAEDRFDHPLLRYATARDFRECRLSFRWRSTGVKALDAVNGPTLTIEGRDAAGAPRAWYVRLWNYATGTPEDAEVSLDFANLAGGFLLPGEADPVWAGDVDRMFVSLVAPGYDGSAAPLAVAAEGWVELTGIACDGLGAVLAIGDAVLPEHGFAIASGYDDSYNLTPARLLRNALHLGYRGTITHYVGMSHYFRLEALYGGYYVGLAGGVLNVACAAWHRDFAARAKALGYDVIWSLSYELFDAHCWNDWKQRAADGAPALTGWEPPSTLLSPSHDGAMGYLRQVAAAFVGIGVGAGLAPRFQVGEPWWWTMPDGRPCLYDAAAAAAFAPAAIPSVRGPLDAGQRATLDRAGAALAASTAALAAAVKAAYPATTTHLLAYLPTVLDRATPELKRANMPLGWAFPAFDVLQLEDYDWVTEGDAAATARGVAAAEARLGYPPERQHYLSGFVLRPDQAAQWALIEAAGMAARRRGVAAVVLWALPQVMRDGFVRFEGDDAMQDYDDVLFPLALGREAEVAPAFSTAILTAAGGAEQRSAGWAEARTGYDVGPGVRSEADIATLLAFFRARMGPAHAFRLRDPFDADGVDEPVGSGDGVRRRFALVKHYGAAERRITRPVAGSVRIAVDGAATQGFALDEGGFVVLDAAPAVGAVVTASFTFDVMVRFAEDRLRVQRATFLAGEAASVPLIEVREVSALACIALCWRIERGDGVAVGLTTHDRDLTIDGLVHRAAPGMTPSAIERSAGLEADTMDVTGALTSAVIGEADLLAGRWDGARVRLFAADWETGATLAELGEGRIGAVELGEEGFTAELAGASAALARPVVEETSAECRAELGDRRCRVPLAARRRFARVVAVAERVVTLDAAEPEPGAYAGGSLRWFGGLNGGLSQAVDASADSDVTLRSAPAFAVAPGALVELVEGCDKSFATCTRRFGNAANFRGEPHLPGIDLLTRYPGG